MSEPTTTADIKAALRAAPSRVSAEFTVDAEGGPLKLAIRRPSTDKIKAMNESWQARGLADAHGQPTGAEQSLTMARELVAASVYLPGAVRQLFTPEELVGVEWLDDAATAVMEVLGRTGKELAATKGN